MAVTVDDIRKTFAGIIPAELMDKLDPAKPLVAQGVDSLAITAMGVALQNAYGVKITVEAGLKLKTLNDVVDFVNAPR